MRLQGLGEKYARTLDGGNGEGLLRLMSKDQGLVHLLDPHKECLSGATVSALRSLGKMYLETLPSTSSFRCLANLFWPSGSGHQSKERRSQLLLDHPIPSRLTNFQFVMLPARWRGMPHPPGGEKGGSSAPPLVALSSVLFFSGDHSQVMQINYIRLASQQSRFF